MFRLLLVAAMLAAYATEARAHPVSFKGGFGVMPEYTPDRRHLELNYSLTASSAVGVSGMELEEDDGDAVFVLPRFNYKLYRRNEIDSQTNVYLAGGVGAADYRDEENAAGFVGFQTDYETRRVYTLLSGDFVRSEDIDHTMLRYRLGVAPYLADFDELNTWLIAQFEYMPEEEDEWVVTPLVRFFYQNYLVEAGASLRGDLFLAGIFHF